MKKTVVFILLLIITLNHVKAQEYDFINEVLTLNKKDNPISNDSIYLKNKFIPLGKQHLSIKSITNESIKIWWNEMGLDLSPPPIELFFKNFNLNHLKSDIIKSQKDSVIDFNKLQDYFFSSSEKFINKNPKKVYLSISKPIFNCNKDWVIIIKSSYMPYTNLGGNGMMFIYFKFDDKWILYHKLSLWS